MEASGRIIAVQEQRFRLATDNGQVLLLRLGHDADTDAAQLCELQEQGSQVTVEYAGAPNLTTGVARSVRTAA